jgi:GTP-binding protein
MLEFHNTKFVLSSQRLSQLPPEMGAEVAFAGRSNAGKSSAINSITGNKNLARVSKTPGRTQLINFFALDDRHRLVDLPGYGYAKVTHSVRKEWQDTLTGYLQTRQCLRGLMLVMDLRHALAPLDTQLLNWCRETAIPVHILLTKADKLGKGPAAEVLFRVRNAVTGLYPVASVQLFSSLKKQGLDEAKVVVTRWLEGKNP